MTVHRPEALTPRARAAVEALTPRQQEIVDEHLHEWDAEADKPWTVAELVAMFEERADESGDEPKLAAELGGIAADIVAREAALL